MADQEHLAILKQGVGVWNKWREEHDDIEPDLRKANLSGADLNGANLLKANLNEADLSKANLNGADLRGTNLGGANLSGAILNKANLDTDLTGLEIERPELRKTNPNRVNLRGANLSGAHLRTSLVGADLTDAILHGADLTNANLVGVDLDNADLSGAFLTHANLMNAVLRGARLYNAVLPAASLIAADLREADLSDALLDMAILVNTDLTKANLSNASIYGISAWNVKLEGATQTNLVITTVDEPTISVDNLMVAQFIYLLLNNQEIRDVIDTIAKKAVLILGRFTPERKVVLEALKIALRLKGYLPILFDFDKPTTQDFTEMVMTLAHLSRFIIADLTDPSSIPYELHVIVPNRMVPVLPLLKEAIDPITGKTIREFAMFHDLRMKYHWVLPTHSYKDLKDLLASFQECVIAPAEQKAKELELR